MRITQLSNFNRLTADQQNIKGQIEQLSRQISSGRKIKNGFEDPQIFADTLRLDYQETTLTQVIDVSEDARNFADNTDSVMFQFVDGLTRFKTLLIQAANQSNTDTNYYAISKELKSLKEHFINLGNSSINGRFLFSGNKLDVKPLDDNGHYYGNGKEIKALVGSNVEIAYNISGEELFYGEDSNVNRKVTTNIALKTQEGNPARIDTTLKEITGNENSYDFDVVGRDGNGNLVQGTVTLTADQTVGNLMDGIRNLFGTETSVDLNQGYLELRDKVEGRNHLDFHIVGKERNGSDTIAMVKTNENTGDESIYDQELFESVREGVVRGNVAQIVKGTQQYADGSTKLKDVSAVALSSGGMVTYGVAAAPQQATAAGRSLTAEINGNEYTINIDDTTTYQELMDRLQRDVADETGNSAEVFLDSTGRLTISSEGLQTFKLYDKEGPSVIFNANNALTIDTPKHDFFESIDQAIEAVEYGLTRPDGENAYLARNSGIQNAITRIGHLLDHVDKAHTKVGAISNRFRYAVERSETIKINVQTLQSKILDTDVGEVTMKLNQLSLNFQALMASVAKVQNLSLVNYM